MSCLSQNTYDSMAQKLTLECGCGCGNNGSSSEYQGGSTNRLEICYNYFSFNYESSAGYTINGLDLNHDNVVLVMESYNAYGTVYNAYNIGDPGVCIISYIGTEDFVVPTPTILDPDNNPITISWTKICTPSCYKADLGPVDPIVTSFQLILGTIDVDCVMTNGYEWDLTDPAWVSYMQNFYQEIFGPQCTLSFEYNDISKTYILTVSNAYNIGITRSSHILTVTDLYFWEETRC